MARSPSGAKLFFAEFIRNFHTTGAILPSGRFLSAALARFVSQEGGGRRILEVGPGTGAVTGHLVSAMKPGDTLDLVELNDSFVAALRERFASDPPFQAVADRARVLHCPIEELSESEPYDVIVSGLPLNNFSVATVEQILGVIQRLAKPGATLSFFEYIAIRKAKTLISRGEERQRLQGIDATLRKLLDGRELKCDWIWLNVPPAWVHHVRLGTAP